MVYHPYFCPKSLDSMFNTVLLFGNAYQKAAIDNIAHLIDVMLTRCEHVAVEDGFYRYLCRQAKDRPMPSVETFDCASDLKADLAVSLGGDGTLLGTVMWVADKGIPVLGINTGHLGYLTACNMAEAAQTFDEVMMGVFQMERRTMLTVECDGVNIEHPFALNDIAILRHDTSSMIEMETTLQGLPLTTYKADGLVVCTPTGSTAYNLSAGGPILEPTTRCLVISPLTPHSLTMRPLVVPDESVLTIVTRSRSDYYQVSVDGEEFTCPVGSQVTIRRAHYDALVIQRSDHNFANTLRHKLHWGS